MKNQILFLLLLSLWTSSARASEFIVNDVSDATDNDTSNGLCETGAGACTLRAAIAQANALAGTDTVRLAPGTTYSLSLAGAGSGIDTGDLNVTDDLQILADGAVIDASAISDRVFDVSGATTINVTLSDITVQGGHSSGNGGGISVQSATVTFEGVTVKGNQSEANGGGIYAASSTINFEECVLSENTAAASGGGLYNGEGTVTLTKSTVDGNTALAGGGLYNTASGATLGLTLVSSAVSGNAATGDGGGIYNAAATLTLTGSTIGENGATGSGGGIYNDANGVVSLSGVTVAENTADSDSNGVGSGGGINNVLGTFTLKNSILADNADNSATAQNCSGTLVSGGYNMADDPAGCTMTVTTGDAIADPLLDAFADWGGVTKAFALKSGSPAIDAGDDVSGCTDRDGGVLAADQRGYSRTVAGRAGGTVRCDIGAYEFKPCDDTGITSYAYMMALHSCDSVAYTDCGLNATHHEIHLAGSNDGVSWTVIEAFEPVTGSVPAIVEFNGSLYLFYRGTWKKYNSCFDETAGMSAAAELYDDGNLYTDYSLIAQGGDLYLLAVRGGEMGLPVPGCDPAEVATTDCHLSTYMAKANFDGDGEITDFTVLPNSATITYYAGGIGGGFTDPDMVELSTGEFLQLVSAGQSSYAYVSSDVESAFAPPPTFTPAVGANSDSFKASDNTGGVPAVIEDMANGALWIYVTMTPWGGVEQIERYAMPRSVITGEGATMTATLAAAQTDYDVMTNAAFLDAAGGAHFATTDFVSSPDVIHWPSSSWSNRVDGDLDEDGDGYDTSEDCNDANANVHPGATEACNGGDDDCDDMMDEGLPMGRYFQDADSDSYGDNAQYYEGCAMPNGYVALAGDCDETNVAVNPGLSELCATAFDDNCDGLANDATSSDAGTWCKDRDRDGYGWAPSARRSCTQPRAFVSDCTDRNDNDATRH